MKNIKSNNHWSICSYEKILKDKNLSNEELSFKFYQLNLESKQKPFFFIYESENINLYFHAIYYKRKFFKFIDSTYSGFIIPNNQKKNYLKNSNKINKLLSKFLKQLKFDILIIRPYPYKIFLNDKLLPHQCNFKGITENNGYIILKKNFEKELSYNQRREIKLGLKNLAKFMLITEKNDNCLDILKGLLKQKLKQKIDMHYINNIFENSQKGLYQIRIVLDDNNIICVLVISLRPGIATQTYNFVSDEYKKEFINKAVHYSVINNLFSNGFIDIFVFGDSIDSSNGMESVTAFKQSFSKHSMLSNKIYHPLNFFGYSYLFLKQIKNIFFNDQN